MQNELNARCQNVSFLFIIVFTNVIRFVFSFVRSFVHSILLCSFRIVYIFQRCYLNSFRSDVDRKCALVVYVCIKIIYPRAMNYKRLCFE